MAARSRRSALHRLCACGRVVGFPIGVWSLSARPRRTGRRDSRRRFESITPAHRADTAPTASEARAAPHRRCGRTRQSSRRTGCSRSRAELAGPSALGGRHRRVERDVRGRALPVRAARVEALLMLSASGRRCWSRWSARSEARTNDLDQPEGRSTLAMGRDLMVRGRPALPGCSTNTSSATTSLIGCPPR